jgi:putative ABC transport system permease protein
MAVWARISSLIRNTLRNRRVEGDLDDEVNAYLDLLTEDKVRAGMSLSQARRAARIELGGVHQVKEEVRQVRAGVFIEELWRDLRLCLRSLARSPGFTVAAVAVMALGIGANSAVFSVVRGVLIRPLPFRDPDSIVQVRETLLSKGLDAMASAPADFEYWRDQNHVFSSIAAYHTHSALNLTGSGDPERLATATVSANFLAVLGVKPKLGRDFLPEEESPGHNAVAIISHRLWASRFASDTDFPGRTINLDGQSYNVAGVMPADFDFPKGVDLWVPIVLPPANSKAAHWRNVDNVLARMGERVTVDQARAEMDTVAGQLALRYPDTNDGVGVVVRPLIDVVAGDVRRTLVVLMTAVLLVLLAGCANVATLTMIRGISRRKELALRAALGAGRPRLIRQQATECLTIALAGGALGLLLAYWGVDFLLALGGDNIPRSESIRIDGAVIGFALLTTIITGIGFGLIPALQVSQPNLLEFLKDEGRVSAGGVRQQFRRIMVVTELALALSLMIGAGLMIKSFGRLQTTNLGFNPDHVLTMSVTLPESRRKQAGTFFPQVIERVQKMPDIKAAGAVWPVPLSGADLIETFRIEGRRPTGDDAVDTPLCNFYCATPGYFTAIGMRLLQGRYFTEGDSANAPRVIIISDTFARHLFAGENPVGRRLLDDGPLEIVGVVEDVRHNSIDEAPLPQVYKAFAQSPFGGMALVLRATGAPANLVTPVRGVVAAIAADQPIADIKSMDDYVSKALSQPRMATLLMGVFALVAMVLAAVGLYGVMANSVVHRTREIGVRMALGAERREVLRLVMTEGMIQTGIGLVLGIGIALGLSRLIASLLFGVSATDAIVFTAVPFALGIVAMVACFVPARRAAAVDPIDALRYQ